MNNTELLFERLRQAGPSPALWSRGERTTYSGLLQEAKSMVGLLESTGVVPGDSVALMGDYNRGSIALLLACILGRNITILMPDQDPALNSKLTEIALPDWIVNATLAAPRFERMAGGNANVPLYERLRKEGHPGLVLFSSGSSGEPKAVVHDFECLLGRFVTPPRPINTLAFMLFDHMAGVCNLLYSLFNQGELVRPDSRDADTVGAAIAERRVGFLPAPASFLNLLLLHRPWETHDFSSLRVIVYGTERVSEKVLAELSTRLPGVRLHQNYGLTESPALRSQSRSSHSPWIRIDDPEASVRVVERRVQIRSPYTMLGYLNAEHRVSVDGWLETGDLAEEAQDGTSSERWIRIIGRESDLISVGGRKVSPAEVEEFLLGLSGVVDVLVCGVPNPLLGQSVKAVFRLARREDPASFRERVRGYCTGRLEAHKIPSIMEIAESEILGRRQKKIRCQTR